MKAKRWTLKHDGFHGLTSVHIMVPADAEAGDVITVSRAVARRIDDECCGPGGCECGESYTSEEGYGDPPEILLPPEGLVIRGHYPQSA